MTIVRDRYPVDRLPEEFRAQLTGIDAVRLIIEPQPREQRSLAEILAAAQRLREEGLIAPITEHEAVDRVRALRDGTDD